MDLQGLALVFLLFALVSLVLAIGFLSGTQSFIAKVVFLVLLILFALTSVKRLTK